MTAVVSASKNGKTGDFMDKDPDLDLFPICGKTEGCDDNELGTLFKLVIVVTVALLWFMKDDCGG